MTNQGQRFAVIGDPISHSLSPVMQNAGLASLGLNAEYVAVHVPPDKLADFAQSAREELTGFNITVPHKSAIIPFLDETGDAVRLAGSVNTVTVRNGKLYGESTDGYGLSAAIDEAFGIQIPDNRFCFIGCGGAVRAVAFYFAEQGAQSLAFINRTESKAEALAKEVAGAYPMVAAAASGLDNEPLIRELLSEASVVIQGTSLGLKPDDPPPVNPEWLPEETCLYDTIYHKTALQKEAEKRGIKTADGRGMLLHQGARSLSIWTGMDAPVEVMRKALYNAIAERERDK